MPKTQASKIDRKNVVRHLMMKNLRSQIKSKRYKLILYCEKEDYMLSLNEHQIGKVDKQGRYILKSLELVYK